ncbi:MAG: hypothetical protein JNJ52_09315 [Flavobacterium sp.]|nr:hypothetical protein [Flavobacterium sp.]
MKSIPLQLILIAILVVLCGCGRGFYYSKDVATNGTPVFTFDENTLVYARKLYAQETEFKGRELTSTTDSLSENSYLTEVQYLFFNQNKVLYVSTVSSRYIYDKTDSYLIHNSTGHNSYPNSFYFNNFYLGHHNTSASLLEFKNKKAAQDWKIEQTSVNEIKLEYINDFALKNVHFQGQTTPQKNFLGSQVVDQSVKHPIVFKKMNHFKFLSFKLPDDSSDYDSSGKVRSTVARTYAKANEIYIAYKDADHQKIDYLFIPFDSELIPNYKALKFGSGKVRYY